MKFNWINNFVKTILIKLVMTKYLFFGLILSLASCEKHENYKQCQETVNGKPYFVKKGKCFEMGDYTWNAYKRVDNKYCSCL